ncbi:hypothetical protein [Photobacterium sanguinicancri]|uniref:hypothetical protein n=1 Tax=Photobacterium sanguinicancri TaxID=875932 RepID=UPI0021C3D57E|nr:hypothetical protein [Photobacterium sanguinicancri]
MNKIFLALSMFAVLVSYNSQATEDTAPTRDPYTHLVNEVKTNKYTMSVKVFDGNRANYGYSPVVEVKVPTDDSHHYIEVKIQNIFDGMSDLKYKLVDNDDNISEQDYSNFLFHQYTPSLKLYPRVMRHGEATLETRADNGIKCEFIGLYDGMDTKRIANNFFLNDGDKYISKFTCPSEDIQNNDMVYDIDWNYGNDLYQAYAPKQLTNGYRVVFLEGDKKLSFDSVPSGVKTPEVYLSSSLQELKPGYIAAHQMGVNLDFKYFIDPTIPEYDPQSERITIEKTIKATIDSLKSLGYSPDSSRVYSVQQANVIIRHGKLEGALAAGIWDQELNKNVLLISDSYNSGLQQKVNKVIAHEIGHIIGLPHQNIQLATVMSEYPDLPVGIKLAPKVGGDDTVENTIFSYVDAQSLQSLVNDQD